MGKRQDRPEELAIQLLITVVNLDRENRDALPGSAVSHVKAALKILKKRRHSERHQQGGDRG